MKAHHCVSDNGEHFTIRQNKEGLFCCPVCGSAEFDEPPYNHDGSASYQICSCGFEYGFDDSKLASKDAVEGIKVNWQRWRLQLIEKSAKSGDDLARLEKNLENIGIELAFDLIPVERGNGK